MNHRLDKVVQFVLIVTERYYIHNNKLLYRFARFRLFRSRTMHDRWWIQTKLNVGSAYSCARAPDILFL